MLEEHEYTNESNPIRYAGEYCDTAYGINLIYLRARYYAPNLRMFITEDPAQDGMNWYAYCGHNPVNFVDPSGMYNRNASVSYARQWAFGTNKEQYERFEEDCANFVSQCLVAGEINMKNSWHYYRNSVLGITYYRDMSRTWSMAYDLWSYFGNKDRGYMEGEMLQIWTEEGMKWNLDHNDMQNIQEGDLMFFAEKTPNGAGKVHHATIISAVRGYEIYYAAHSGNHEYEELSKHLQNEMVYIIRIRDDAINGYWSD